MDESALCRCTSTMDKPIVSVIIPTLGNRPEWLKEAIESVNNQTFRDFELIIADNVTSTDNFRWNNAVKNSNGKYIVILSDDDMLFPDFLDKTVYEIEKGRVDIVGTFLEVFGDFPEGEGGIHGPSKFPFFTSLFTKAIWEKVGGWDSTIGPMGDVEFWWRCFGAGAKWSIIGEPLYKYRKHAGQESNNCDWEDSRRKVLAKHKNYSW